MEWIEVTGKTIDDAKEEALDQLGVDESDAEFEIVEAPKGGLFGRLRSEARVRARVFPTTPRPKLDRRERRRSGTRSASGGGGGSGEAGGGVRGGPPPRPQAQAGKRAKPPAREGVATVTDEATAARRDEVAEEFLAGLLEIFGVASTIETRRLEEDTTELAVQGEGLGLLIGQRGQTLSAVQELTRTVVQRNLAAPHGRIVVDVAGYRQARRSALERFTRTVADEVVATGVARMLEAMPPADRKVVHDTVNKIPGVVTKSEGEEPRRRVLIALDLSASGTTGLTGPESDDLEESASP